MGGFFVAVIQKSKPLERSMPLQKQNDSTEKNVTANNTITKKIGKSVYQVQIHFSQNSKDDFNDKLLRLIKNDVAENAKAC